MTTCWRLLWVTLTLITVPAFADDSGHPLTLWEVEGERNTVFLLGSIHLLRKQDYPLPSMIDTAYAESEVLIMEIDMDDLDPIEAQLLLNQYGILRDGRSLSDLMGDEAYLKAEKAAQVIDIPLDMLSKTEPWYAAMTVEILMLSRLGFDPSLGVEMVMMRKAQTDGKRIDGLETMQEQLGFLDGMSLQAQIDMLLSTLTESAELESVMDDVINAWHHGDIDTLTSSMLDEIEKHEELNKALLLDRNANWVEKIQDHLHDDVDYMIVVGALHLIGQDGVPATLSRLGYDVKQLSEPLAVR